MPKERILVIDDERSLREFLEILFEEDGYEVKTVENVELGVKALSQFNPDVVFTDLRMPDGSGIDVLKHCAAHHPAVQVIMMTAYASAEEAVTAMKLGAYDYQIKPFKVDELRALTQKAFEKVSLIRENKRLSSRLQQLQPQKTSLVCESDVMKRLLGTAERVARTDATVLITGESGTGKEILSRYIHEQSPRRQHDFVAVNCGAIPENLIESELFGHQAGAFTGATRERSGLFESAHGGTLLLDEVAELPLQTQVKLLRVLQEKTVRAVGGDRERPVDVRIVAATNRDLKDMVAAGTFREDLFYRLNVVTLHTPPLRERGDDISALAAVFVESFATRAGLTPPRLSSESVVALRRYAFPGNVRELQNIVERAIALAEGDTISPTDLLLETRSSTAPAESTPTDLGEGVDLEALLEEVERRYFAAALRQSGGKKKEAAALLGLSFRSFRYKLSKWEEP